MTVCGHRTHPLLMMAIQITHKQERDMDIVRLHGLRMSVLVHAGKQSKLGRLGQGCGFVSHYKL